MSLGSMLEVVFMLQVKRSDRGFTPPPPPPPADEGVEVPTDAWSRKFPVGVAGITPALGGGAWVEADKDAAAEEDAVVDDRVDEGGCCCCSAGLLPWSSIASPVTGFFNLLEILEKIEPR